MKNDLDKSVPRLIAAFENLSIAARRASMETPEPSPEDDFDARLELKILAAQLNLRVHIEILGNRAHRDLDLFAHQKFCELYQSINRGYRSAELYATHARMEYIGAALAAFIADIDPTVSASLPRDPDEVYSIHTLIIDQRAAA